MRLERIASAVAIAIVVLGAFPPHAAADASPTTGIVSPANGATVVAQQTIRIHYAGYSAGAQNISGYLTLDGEPAGTFLRPVAGAPSNGTTFNATLNAPGFASGAHVLGARVFTELDAPVGAPGIDVVLDLPPTIADVAHSYDLDARRLHVSATVTDDGGASSVRLATGMNNTTVVGSGALAFDLAARRGPGSYVAFVNATDSIGQRTRVTFTYVVADREAVIGDLTASYELGGIVRIQVSATDPDGGVADVKATSALSNQSQSQTWGSNGSYQLQLHVQAELGTHHGTLTTYDANGGTTSAAFTFTIGGAREVFFERSVTTETGGYADSASMAIPSLLDGWIEICVDGCAPLAPGPSPAGTAYGAVCGGVQSNSLLCAQLTGRQGTGQLKPCSSAPPPNNLLGSTLWTAAQAADAALGGIAPGPCTHAFDAANETAGDPTRPVGPNGTVLVALRVSYEPGLSIGLCGLVHIDCAPRAPDVLCTSTGSSYGAANNTTAPASACGYHARNGAKVDLSWAQGPEHTVTVRVSGIRV